MGTLTNNNIRSKDVAARFFTTGNQELRLNHLDFSVDEMATEGTDDLAGSDRSDPYTVTNYFEVGFNGTQLDNTLLDDFIANIASKDADTGENPAVVIVQIKTLGGVTTTYTFTGVTRKPFKLNASGRADPWKLGSGFKAKYMQKT